MKKQSKKLIPPDGGWGWMVCLGNSLISLSLRGLDPSFGLLFGDLLKDLKVDTAGAASVMSVLDAVFSFSGMFMGPLLRRFSCRKVAAFGTLLSCTGLMLTSQANSLIQIICTYSILGGFGTGLATTAGFVSLNSYFREKRTQFVGLSMVGTTLGTMCMPQIVNLLLDKYDFRGAVLILSAIALHSVVGSILFQPVAWHLKPAPTEKHLKPVSDGAADEEDTLLTMKETDKEKKLRKVSIKSSALEISSLDLTQDHWKDEKSTQEVQTCDENGKKNGNEQKANTSLIGKFVKFFDLNLVKDPIFLNILLGMSLYYQADMNFKFILPFFLKSIGMPKTDVALCISVSAFSDLAARLTMPTIFTKCKFKNRNVLWTSVTLLCIIRLVIAELAPSNTLMMMLVLNGFLRGTAMTNFNLTIAEYCSLDMLPSALGIASVTRGTFVAILGPIVGYIRDVTGSYQIYIRTISSVIAVCSIMWGIEFVVKQIYMRRNKSTKGSEPDVP